VSTSARAQHSISNTQHILSHQANVLIPVATVAKKYTMTTLLCAGICGERTGAAEDMFACWGGER
jgi:hypothetical protein